MSDEFEYFTVAISIVIALGIGRLLDGIAPVSLGLVLLAAIAVVGLVTENRRIHAILVVMALTVQIVGLGAAMFQSGTI